MFTKLLRCCFSLFASGLLMLGWTSASAANEMPPLISFAYGHNATYVQGCYHYALTLQENGEVRLQMEMAGRDKMLDEAADAELLEKIRDILARHNVRAWNGFHETDPNVLDGSGFSLSARFADGTGVSASGSNAFPHGYGKVMAELRPLIEPQVNRMALGEY